MYTTMTNRERIIFLSIFISVLGFSLFSVFNPLENHIGKQSFVIASEYISKAPLIEEVYKQDYDLDSSYYSDSDTSKVVRMLSSVLDISVDDVQESLDGGVKPHEMLASSGILLSDLEEEFNFDVIGQRGLIRFRV